MQQNNNANNNAHLLSIVAGEVQLIAQVKESKKGGLTGKVCIVSPTMPHNVWLSVAEYERLTEGSYAELEDYGIVPPTDAHNVAALLESVAKGDKAAQKKLTGKGQLRCKADMVAAILG